MRVLIDGVDGTGKTSVTEKLANRLGCNIIRLTHDGDRNFRAYSESMIPDNMVHDRTFLSEMIYSSIFKRGSRLNIDCTSALFRLIDQYNAKVFILTANIVTLNERLNKRGDEFIDDFSVIEKIDLKYQQIAYLHDFEVIDTTCKNVDQVVDEIIKRLGVE